jgi:hypothetical protein
MKANGGAGRRPDWPLLLEVFVDQRRDWRFEWGRNDCVTFAAAWVALARPDLDPMEQVERAGHHSAREALEWLAGRDLAQVMDEWGELTRIDPAFAQRGDVVLVDNEGRPALAVCVGGYAVGPGAEGAQFAPIATARAAWRV